MYTIFPFPFPLTVFTASHDADDFAVHGTLAVTPSSLLLAADAVNERELAFRVSAAVARPFCVTMKYRVKPPPLTVMPHTRDDVLGLAATLYTIFPFPFPLFVFSTSHGTNDSADQDWPAVTASSLLFAAAAENVREWAPNRSSLVSLPLCVTVNVRVSPPPVTVIFPVLELVPVFAATLYTIFPFPFPLAVFTVSHETDDFTVHDTFAVTASSLPLSDAAVKDRELAPSVSVVVPLPPLLPVPLCVTVNVRVSPPPLTVIVPDLELAPVFAATLYAIFPFPLPLAVFTVSHEADDFAVHDTFAVTPSSPLAAAAVNDRELAASVSAAATEPVRNTFVPATTFPVPLAVYWAPPYLRDAVPAGSQKRSLPPTG